MQGDSISLILHPASYRSLPGAFFPEATSVAWLRTAGLHKGGGLLIIALSAVLGAPDGVGDALAQAGCCGVAFRGSDKFLPCGCAYILLLLSV